MGSYCVILSAFMILSISKNNTRGQRSDPEHDRQSRLYKLSPQYTVLCAAHRLFTPHSDEVLMLKASKYFEALGHCATD